MPANNYVSDKPVLLRAEIKDAKFYRADLKFVEVDHSGATFEARVFLNNPAADENTPKTPDAGYAGSFYVFGHGGCFGDEGHCDVPKQQRPNDLRDPHPLVPKDFTVSITEALRRQLEKGPEIQITVVPVVMAATDKCDLTNVLKFTRFEILTYK
jgi:hypothetical protein